ncbi:MAG: hypothetical protein KKE12_14130 [Proteobacteria bacterium]|nr:hypothetical protein [Pseudomonadota bacterium]
MDLKKNFGIGPEGATISLFLLAIVVWADSMIKLSIAVDYAKQTGRFFPKVLNCGFND